MMTPVRAILSIHDAAPPWREETEHALHLIEECCAIPPALLVVPDFHEEAPLSRHTAFIDTLNDSIDKGSEILLHGYHHIEGPVTQRTVSRELRARMLTAGEGEFLDLDVDATAKRLQAGLEELRVLRAAPAGFVAPAWLYNRHTFFALENLGLRFTEGHGFVYNLFTGQRFFMPAISFCARDPLRANGSVQYARALTRLLSAAPFGGFRLALHPADFRHPPLVEAIGEFLKRSSGVVQWIQYRDLRDTPVAVGRGIS